MVLNVHRDQKSEFVVVIHAIFPVVREDEVLRSEYVVFIYIYAYTVSVA